MHYVFLQKILENTRLKTVTTFGRRFNVYIQSCADF